MYGHMWKRMEVKWGLKVIDDEWRKLGEDHGRSDKTGKTTEGCSLMYVYIIHMYTLHR